MSFRTALMIHAASPYRRRLNYLTSSGTQYIDTGIKLHGDYKVKVTFGQQLIGIDNNARRVFGARDTANGAFMLFQNPANTPTAMQKAYKSSNQNVSYATAGTFSVLEMHEGNLYFDGVQKGGTTSPVEFEQDNNCWLFMANLTGLAQTGSVCSIARFEIFDGDENKLQDLIPVVDFNDEPCMYDEVTGIFFRNAGSGTFLYG